MIDLSEMAQKLSEKLDLEGHKTEAFTVKVQEFSAILESSTETANGFEAIEILSVLVSFKENFNLESKWEDLVYRCLVIIRQNIYERKYRPFSAYTGIGSIAFVLHDPGVMLFS